jgi:hypothetical protein
VVTCVARIGALLFPNPDPAVSSAVSHGSKGKKGAAAAAAVGDRAEVAPDAVGKFFMLGAEFAGDLEGLAVTPATGRALVALVQGSALEIASDAGTVASLFAALRGGRGSSEAVVITVANHAVALGIARAAAAATLLSYVQVRPVAARGGLGGCH